MYKVKYVKGSEKCSCKKNGVFWDVKQGDKESMNYEQRYL
jgi:hypothetical protein